MHRGNWLAFHAEDETTTRTCGMTTWSSLSFARKVAAINLSLRLVGMVEWCDKCNVRVSRPLQMNFLCVCVCECEHKQQFPCCFVPLQRKCKACVQMTIYPVEARSAMSFERGERAARTNPSLIV